MRKTLGEKKKLLVTSNFSFSHNDFHRYISLARQNAALCGDGLKKKIKTVVMKNRFPLHVMYVDLHVN